MDSFFSFFKRSPSKPTKSSRTHHQTLGRMMNMGNRQHLNMVGKVHGKQMKNSTVENFLKNKNIKTNISRPVALDILKDFGMNHTPGQTYCKAINRTGSYIHYNHETQKWTLSKSKIL